MAETGGFHYGVKLVRGAYMEQERALAIEQGKLRPKMIIIIIQPVLFFYRI